MMLKDQSFVNIDDEATIRRLLRSLDIRTINRFEYFEAVNIKNAHRYKVKIQGQNIVCSCPDAIA